MPIAIEFHRVFSKSASDFFHELELRATTVTLEVRGTSFLYQHLSIAIQRFNAACFANTFFINYTANFKVFVSNAHPVTIAFTSFQ